jgi:hypothetical protein
MPTEMPEDKQRRIAAEGAAVWENAKLHHDGDPECAGHTLGQEYVRVRDKLKEYEDE